MTVTASLPLTSVTADDLKAEMITFLSAYFPDWTDKSDSNSMVPLIETVGALGEFMYAYINKQARETYIQYAVDPRNVDAHARGLGYTPKYATASTVDATLSVPQNVSGDTPILAGSKFSTLLPGVFYELVANATIKAGTNTVGPVTLAHQESFTQEAGGTGAAYTTIQLNQDNVMPDTVTVTVDGVSWTKVEHFVDSDPTSLHYLLRVSTIDHSVSVVFGDGMCGKIPAKSSAILVSFKSGGGKAGAIASHYLRQCVTQIRDGATNQILSVTADNDYAANPGADAETTDQIKVHARSYVRAPRVLFDLDDVEAAVSSVPGVSAVKAVNWEVMEGLPHHLIELFIFPSSATASSLECSPALKESILNYLTADRPLVMGQKAVIGTATYRKLDFNLQVNVLAGYSATAVKQAIMTMLNALFDPVQTNVWGFKPTFGMSIYSSQLIAILQSIEGVRNLIMLSPADTDLSVSEFPVINSISFV